MPRIQDDQATDTLLCVDDDATSDPIAVVKLFTSKRGNTFFQVLSCPYCRGSHQHSVPATWLPGDSCGHRVADCLTPAQRFDGHCGYELVLAPEHLS